MERLAVWASRVVGAALVAYTVWAVLWSLVLLGVVVAGVVAVCRYVERQQDRVLPPAGRVVVITGCDTGIGHEVAVTASARGLTVVAGCLDQHSAGAQRLAGLERLHVLPLDVTDDDSIRSAVDVVTELCGDKGLWAVVNNAGLNRQAPVELTSMGTFRHLADVMLFGTVRVTKAFLPLLRRARGRVVTMSSDRGLLSPAYSAAYCVTKHGVETFSDVLRTEMTSFGVRVCVMQIGHFGGATAIINDENLEAMRDSMERDLQQCDPEVQQAYGGQRVLQRILAETRGSRDVSPRDVTPVVRAILHSLLSAEPAERYAIHGSTGPFDWGIVLGQVKPFLPTAVFNVIQRTVWRS